MPGELTHALEDYLETIRDLVREKGMARIRDICVARGVKSGSVSPAVYRLAEMGLIEHQRGEYISLTPAGEVIAARIRARHDTLLWLFRDLLGVDPVIAERDACNIEHYLSDTSLDALVGLHEHIGEFHDVLDRMLPEDDSRVRLHRESECRFCSGNGCDQDVPREFRTLSSLDVGDCGTVVRVAADDVMRVRLLNYGLIPGAVVEVNRIRKGGGMQILVSGSCVELSGDESASVFLR